MFTRPNILCLPVPLMLALMLAVPGPVRAETKDAAAVGRDLGAVETELQDSTRRQADLVSEITAAIKAQEDVSTRLVALGKTVSAQEESLTASTARLKSLAEEGARAQLALAEKQDVLSYLLAGLQKLEQNPPPALVVEPGDVLKALRGAMMFGAVIPELRAETDALHAALMRLVALRAETETEKARQSDALYALNISRTEMKNLLAEKRALAAQSALGLDVEKQKAQALSSKAKNLKELLAGLEKAKKEEDAQRSAAEKSRLEAERLRQEALARPAMAFSMARGRLSYPAQGQVLRNFGDENGLGGKLDGILLATQAKAQVLAPADGRIEFAGLFRSYGQLLILNPGEGYLVLMAGMDEISASPGQSVRAGEPVGLMGEKQSVMTLANGLTNQDSPVLYVEFRKKDVSVDPSPWWVGSRKEAMR